MFPQSKCCLAQTYVLLSVYFYESEMNQQSVSECPIDLLVSYTISEGGKKTTMGFIGSFCVQQRHNIIIKLILINKTEYGRSARTYPKMLSHKEN